MFHAESSDWTAAPFARFDDRPVGVLLLAEGATVVYGNRVAVRVLPAPPGDR
ncbi:MAG: hypothetical protein AB1664_10250 [Thermodesulfobacteriota bacterium]